MATVAYLLHLGHLASRSQRLHLYLIAVTADEFSRAPGYIGTSVRPSHHSSLTDSSRAVNACTFASHQRRDETHSQRVVSSVLNVMNDVRTETYLRSGLASFSRCCKANVYGDD